MHKYNKYNCFFVQMQERIYDNPCFFTLIGSKVNSYGCGWAQMSQNWCQKVNVFVIFVTFVYVVPL